MQNKKGVGNVKPIQKKEIKPACAHKNLVIYEIQFGSRLRGSSFMEQHYDWDVMATSAHIARVSKYICVDCKRIIETPYKKEKANELNT